MEKLKDWYVFDPTDFDGVSIDATKWDDDVYTVSFNYYCTKENEDDDQVGFTICTTIFGSNLEECHERIMEVLDSGFFDDIEVSSHGTLYDKEGDEIEEICWNEFIDEEELEGEIHLKDFKEKTPTLH